MTLAPQLPKGNGTSGLIYINGQSTRLPYAQRVLRYDCYFLNADRQIVRTGAVFEPTDEHACKAAQDLLRSG